MQTDAGMSETERRLVEATRTGAPLDLSRGDPGVDNVANASAWHMHRVVRAELLADLLSGRHRSSDASPRGVKLRGARIRGQLDLAATSLIRPLFLENCYLDEAINVCDAQIPALLLHGCQVPKILGNRLDARGRVEFCNGFTAHGGIDLTEARIGGSLVLDNADLANSDGCALRARGITIDGNMLCRNLTARSTVDIGDAHIKSSLDFSGAKLSGRDDVALAASRITVERVALFRNGFKATGMVQIRNSRVGAFVDFADANLVNPAGFALQAVGLIAERSIFFGEGFSASGEVTLYGARAVRLGIGGRFNNSDGVAIDLKHVSAMSVSLLPSQPPDGLVDLSFGNVVHLSDDPETWPTRLRLRGFTYVTLENDSVNVQSRLRWLGLHDGGYAPGIYDQLATAYRQGGRVEASRTVSVAKQRRRRQELNPFGKAWNLLLYLTVGYGYRTWWAGLWLLGLLTIGSLVFAGAYPEHMAPAAGIVPSFQPVAYTVDVLVPLVDLGQKKAWIPRGGTAMICSWKLTGSGWLLTTAAVAGLTNALKRD
jgi:hypothetical protein